MPPERVAGRPLPAPSGALLLRGVEVEGHLVDVRVRAGRVHEIVRSDDRLSPGASMRSTAGEPVVDGRGGALLPGLADLHLHLLALAARAGSVDCAEPAVRDAGGLVERLALAVPDGTGWVRAVGYDEQLAGPLDRHRLDALKPAPLQPVPLRVQEQSGALWVLDSAAVQRLDLDAASHAGIERDPAGRATGRLWRSDAWLRGRLSERGCPPAPPDLSAVGRTLAAYGITAVTDATPDPGDTALELLAAARASGDLPQQLTVLAHTAPAGLSTGPVKLVLADSDLPTLPDLVARLRPLRAEGRPVAVHTVTAASLVLLLTALDATGRVVGDRVEHAAVVPPAVVPRLRGLHVVTQPGFLAVRGSRFRATVDPTELAGLYPYGRLRAAGVAVAPSSDAPFGPLDPWVGIRTARDRVADDGRPLGPAERVPAGVALAGYLSHPAAPGGPPRRVLVGAPADLCLLAVPLVDALADPQASHVRLTVVAGRVVHPTGWAP